MPDLAGTIVRLMRACVRDRRLKVGLFYRGDLSIAQQVISEGHRTVLVGDRFQKLFGAHQRLQRAASQTLAVVEARFGYLPIGDQSLDVLIMSCGLPKGDPPQVALIHLRRSLKPGGLLIWPHPVTDGLWGRLGRSRDVFQRWRHSAVRRRQLCSWTMEAGFGEVGQAEVEGGLFPWVITTGRAGNRPWEHIEKNFAPC